MLWKCCTQYARKFGKLSSGHRTETGHFSFQSQRKAMPKRVQTTAQLHPSYTLVKWSEVAQSCPTLCDPMDSSLLGSAIHGIFQARILEWAAISFSSKVMLKILQARLQQYLNSEPPDVQAGFKKGRGTRDQIVNICWIIKKAREFQKNIYFCFIDYAKAFHCVGHHKLENSERDGNTKPPDLPLEKLICRSGSNS